jgi:hypothetical protein
MEAFVIDQFPSHVSHLTDDFVEVAKCRRFAVTGKRDVVQPPEMRRGRCKPKLLKQVARRYSLQHRREFGQQLVGFDKTRF